MRGQAELAHRASQAAASRAELGVGTASVLTDNGNGSGSGAEGSTERLGECVHRFRLQDRGRDLFFLAWLRLASDSETVDAPDATDRSVG